MQNTRSLILEKALALVPFDGWSEAMLRQAAKHAGVSESDLRRTFPQGASDCLQYFFDEADDALIQEFPDGTLAKLRMPERIEALLLARFEHWHPAREAVRRAVAARSLPWNALRGVESLTRTVDVMWRLAGDSSTDFSYYTKRATLAGIYSSTLLRWLNDTSEGDADTREFLKRRLAGVAAFGKWKKELQGKAKRWGA